MDQPGDRETSADVSQSWTESIKVEDILPAELPGISIASGLGRVAGNKQLYTKLLCKFKDGQESAVGQIKAALQFGDLDTAAGLLTR